MVFQYLDISFKLSIVLILAVTLTSHQFIEKDFSEFRVIDQSKSTMATNKLIYACDFEVFGKVQGVFFRKYTEKQAKSLGLHGWCMNTNQGTVKGQMEGPLAEVNEMKYWLQNKGSPKSSIQKAEFTPANEIQSYTFKTFSIRR